MRSIVPLLALSALALTALAQVVPQWWHQRSIFEPSAPADDFVAVNQGQLKHFARAAVQEFNALLPPGNGQGAGAELNNLIASWETPTADTDDFQVVTVGQLKALGDAFYRRLDQVRILKVPDWNAITPPWSGLGKVSPINAEIVNIGQVKELFFSLEGNRSDFTSGGWNTLSENARFGLSWWADSDGDGFSDLEEILHESDPDDPTGLPSLRLEVVSGNGQQVIHDQVTAPITFAVKRGFSTSAQGDVTLGGGPGEVRNSPTGEWDSQSTVTTGVDGLAAFWWKAPSTGSGPVPLSATIPDVTSTQAYVNLITDGDPPPANLEIGGELPLILGAGCTASREVVVTLSQGGPQGGPLGGRQIIAQANGGAGSITPSSMMTDAQGQAVFQWRAASVIGSGTLHFSAPGLPSAQPEEIETQTIAPPILERFSLNALQGVVSSTAVVPVTLRVLQQGAALAGAKVRLSVSGIGGSLAASELGPWGTTQELASSPTGYVGAWWRPSTEVGSGTVTATQPDYPWQLSVTIPSQTYPPGGGPGGPGGPGDPGNPGTDSQSIPPIRLTHRSRAILNHQDHIKVQGDPEYPKTYEHLRTFDSWRHADLSVESAWPWESRPFSYVGVAQDRWKERLPLPAGTLADVWHEIYEGAQGGISAGHVHIFHYFDNSSGTGNGSWAKTHSIGMTEFRLQADEPVPVAVSRSFLLVRRTGSPADFAKYYLLQWRATDLAYSQAGPSFPYSQTDSIFNFEYHYDLGEDAQGNATYDPRRMLPMDGEPVLRAVTLTIPEGGIQSLPFTVDAAHLGIYNPSVEGAPKETLLVPEIPANSCRLTECFLYPVEIVVPDVPDNRRGDDPTILPVLDGDAVGGSIADNPSPTTSPTTEPPANVPDFTNSQLQRASELRVAKMENSLNSSHHIEPNRDPDAFRITVGGLTLGKRYFIEIETLNKDGTVCDPATEIELRPPPPNFPDIKVWGTPLMLLVTDDYDNNAPVILTSPTGPSRLVDPDDPERPTLTHKVSLGGKVVVTKLRTEDGPSVEFTDLNREVKSYGRVKVKVAIMSDVAPDVATVREKVAADLKNAKERFAQVGVEIEDISATNNEVSVSSRGLSHSQIVDEQVIHLNSPVYKIRGSIPTAELTDVHIFYCRNAKDGSGNVLRGLFIRQNGFASSVFISSENGTVNTLAHEIGHVLERRNGHYGGTKPQGLPEDYGNDDPAHKIQHNLLRGGGTDNHKFHSGSKRLHLKQENRMFRRE